MRQEKNRKLVNFEHFPKLKFWVPRSEERRQFLLAILLRTARPCPYRWPILCPGWPVESCDARIFAPVMISRNLRSVRPIGESPAAMKAQRIEGPTSWKVGAGLVGLFVLVFAVESGRFLVVDLPRRSDVIVVLAGETYRRPARAFELLNSGYASP